MAWYGFGLVGSSGRICGRFHLLLAFFRASNIIAAEARSLFPSSIFIPTPH